MKRGLLIYNPTAGQRDRRAQMRAVSERVKSRGLELISAPTDAPGHATEIVRSFLPSGLDVVVVCGGDGTISETAGGLAGTAVPLAILAGGTSNVLARELSIPLDLEDAIALLFDGVPRRVRVVFTQTSPLPLSGGGGGGARL